MGEDLEEISPCLIPSDGWDVRGIERVESAITRHLRCQQDSGKQEGKGRGSYRIRDQRTRPGDSWDVASRRRNRRACNPLSPASRLYFAALLTGGLEAHPAKPLHINPPIPLFKIPPAQWSAVLQRVAQGESLRQIARSYHTSYEAVRRVLNASRKDLLASQGEPVALPSVDAKEESSKE